MGQPDIFTNFAADRFVAGIRSRVEFRKRKLISFLRHVQLSIHGNLKI